MKTDPISGSDIPDTPEFDVGQRYNRWDLHDTYGGQRYRGIATPADSDAVFLFTGDSGKDYGYEDQFLEDGRFIYTGEGQVGDMEFVAGNKAIRDHKENAERLFVFEDVDKAWIVSYVGEYEYSDHRVDTLPDENGDYRDAIRFELVPVGGTEVAIEETGGGSSVDELYKRAKASSPKSVTSSEDTTSGSRKQYPRSQAVKDYALAAADGVCQGCGEDAPFVDSKGKPFLEVHHLYRRSDGGADDPDNVLALCPNCHRRVHHGKDGDEFNQTLIEQTEATR
ncbi:HNH endonuclease [Haloprofundus salinisoli]|uniref:HNH endonuclease n=1 Tax=Haloprofundus salinisoli TaxID=2876193 RepID=UPI001CCAFA35|nr:HNH endonuclease signature motif containing protein [Haloprofundus salinisoli]